MFWKIEKQQCDGYNFGEGLSHCPVCSEKGFGDGTWRNGIDTPPCHQRNGKLWVEHMARRFRKNIIITIVLGLIIGLAIWIAKQYH